MAKRETRILVAPGSYKSTLKSKDAADAIAAALQQALPSASVEKLVLADGGEGTLEVFDEHFGLQTLPCDVHGPSGDQVSAKLGFLRERVAVIESAQAIGFSLVKPAKMDPFQSSSYGLGELMKHAIENGATKLMVTMGDSATMDMGVGMLYALGVKFYSGGVEIPWPSLADLGRIEDFDDTALRRTVGLVPVLCLVDTNDYLCGPMGQVQLYGHQKGLKESDIAYVESSYHHFATLLKARLAVDVTGVVRTAGSGGVAAALHAFLGAELINTLDYLARALEVDNRIMDADVTITGEGCLDLQTKLGKVPYYVAARSTNLCIGIVGRCTRTGLDDMLGVCRQFAMFTMDSEISMKAPAVALQVVASSIGHILGAR